MKKLCTAKTFRLIGVFGILVVVVIQLIPVNRDNPPVESEIAAPLEVRAVLRRACYDCHSNETTWPWYSKVAPVSWLIASHVEEGRKELNFSSWDKYSDKKKVKKLKESWEEIVEGEMPPWDFLLMHRDARLSPEDKELVHKWILESTGSN